MVAGAVTGFPVWISLSSDPDLIAHARDDHSDVYFTDASGTAIPYEITGWSRANGTLQAWVRAAQLTPTPGTTNANLIYLRFGGGAAPMASSGPAVFDSTISAWVDQAAIAAGTYANTIVVLGAPMPGKSRWFYSSYRGDGNSVAAGLYGGGTNDEAPSTAKLVTPQVWTKLDWVIGPGSTSTLYINGRAVDSKTLVTPNTSVGTGTIANAGASYSGGGSMAFVGVLDEVRIANTSRSASWLLTEYN